MDGLKVVQFGTYYAGPLLGRLLSGLGCRVTAVERPLAARGRRAEISRVDAIHSELHRGHEDVVVLSLPREIEVAERLIRQADIVIENFSPRVMERLGVGYDACRAWNPHVVYVSLPGFSPGETEVRPKAFESIVLACSGVFQNMGLNRELRGIEASFTHLPMASVYGAFHALFATLSAVHGMQRPVHLTVPLASALSETMVHNSLEFPLHECYMNPRQRYLHKKLPLPVTSRDLDDLTCPFFRVYECRDGRWLYLVCPAHATHQIRAIRVLGVEQEVLHHISVVNPYRSDKDSLNGIGTGSLNECQIKAVRPILQRAFLQRDADEWERLLGISGVPASVARTTDEWSCNPHAIESGLIDEDGHLSDPVWFNDYAACPPPPSPSSTDACPLDGVRVLDLCNVIAGPTVGAYLARMGAEVIKVDAPNPTYSPEVSVIYGLACNVGKRSVLMDVTRSDGRDAWRALVATADLVLVNCTDPALHRLGLHTSTLREVNPRAILVRFDAWGGPKERGSMKDWIGYDDCVQAGIGIMRRFGGGKPEEHAHIGTIDVVAGVACATAAVSALLVRRRFHLTCVARCSLVAVGQYLQLPFMTRGVTRSFHGTGIDCVGEHALHRAYRARDGFVFVQTPAFSVVDRQLSQALSYALGGPLRDGSFLALDRESAISLVRSCGGEACALVSLHDVARRSTVERVDVSRDAPTFQYIVDAEHPIGSLRIVAPHCIRGLRLARLASAPKYGAHTRDVIASVAKEWTTLVWKGVCAMAWSKQYMPFSRPCDCCGERGRRLALPKRCDHACCSACAEERRCSVCGMPRGLDRALWAAWKHDYASWRKGGFKGAKGEMP